MAVQALRESLVNNLAVGRSMATLTFRYCRVLSLVAVHAIQLAVLGSGFGEVVRHIAVTGTAEFHRRILGRHDVARLMRIMADQAILHFLTFHVRLVTLGAVGDEAVLVMAESTRLFGMFARVFVDKLQFFFMAGAAFALRRIRQNKRGDRHMGIGVAAEAVRQLKMRRVAVAVAARAKRNEVRAVRQMLHMTIEAGDFRLVFAAIGGNFRRLFFMAFDAICGFQLRSADGQGLLL